jgi:hypothetical protein
LPSIRAPFVGPIDWTSTAGIVAMTELAFRGGPPRDEALAWFERLEATPVGPAAHDCIAVPLVECMLQLDFLDAGHIEALRQRRRELVG